MAGFSSRSYFAQTFKKACDMTAQQYRKAYKNDKDS
jgi:AraC-like DNA-binding protein